MPPDKARPLIAVGPASTRNVSIRQKGISRGTFQVPYDMVRAAQSRQVGWVQHILRDVTHELAKTHWSTRETLSDSDA
jgi:hypothetical protein